MSPCFIGAERAGPGDGRTVTIPTDHEFWRFVDIVDTLDTSRFEAAYREDGSGGQPYDPRLILVAILWCYRLGHRSPTVIANDCRDLVCLAAWFGDRKPSRSTIRGFLLRHQRAIGDLLSQCLARGRDEGTLETSLTATDGTPFEAPSSLSRCVPLWRLRLLISETAQDLDRVRHPTDPPTDDRDLPNLVELVCGQRYELERRLVRRLARLTRAEAVAADRASRERGCDPDRERQDLQEALEHKERRLVELTAQQQEKYDHSQRRLARGERLTKRAVRPEDLKCLRDRRRAIEDLKKSSLSGPSPVISHV